ncbi:hypothetical protein BIW11_05649 [Tropilaelaps mercedesae]|uniref:Uncharacterized protein n=1 Tax=Tropilaelaps mercedesae TaxID=418985 RepID=A0A1V9Y1E9_9ACAR|nr:hypothetical protein BIW11_05649 [Tropilaelaps mercedesae]
MGKQFPTNILQQSLDLNREAIKAGEPVLIGTFQLGLFDLKDGRLYNAFTTNILSEVKVQCINKTIYLWVPLVIQEPRVIFDLVYLTNIGAGELLIYLDGLYLNVTLAIPKPPKPPGAKTKVLKLNLLATPGLGFRSSTRNPLGAVLSTALNLLLRTFRWPAVRIVEIIIEDLTKRFVDKTDLPL